MAESKVVEQRGLWLDEMEVGTVYKHAPGRTITEADNTWFTAVTMNTQALHLDAAFAETEPFGQRLVNSMFTLATLIGLSVSQLTQHDRRQPRLLRGQLPGPALPRRHPLRGDDDPRQARLEVASRAGIVTLEHRGYNQNGQLVAKAVRQTMMFDSSHAKPTPAEATPETAPTVPSETAPSETGE